MWGLQVRLLLGAPLIPLSQIRVEGQLKFSGRSAAWLPHLIWDQGIKSSNLFAPTIEKLTPFGVFFTLNIGFFFRPGKMYLCFLDLWQSLSRCEQACLCLAEGQRGVFRDLISS